MFAFFAGITGIAPAGEQFQISLGGAPISGIGWFFRGLGLALPLGCILWAILHRRAVKDLDCGNCGAGIFSVATITILVAALTMGIFLKWNLAHLTPDSAWKLFEFLGLTHILSAAFFFPVYWILGTRVRNILRKVDLNVDLLDDVNYKTVSFGYPLYMVGALFAGAIWAEQAWGQFWGWDPKEVGALIIWLFYTGYLHARRLPGWRGGKAAVLSVFGLLMILLSFFGNYFFGGQHAYV